MLASALLPGCVSFYQQPAAGEKSAQLAARMPAETRDFLARTSTALVEISGFADAKCTPGTGNGRVLVLATTWGEIKNARLAAGRRLYLQIYRNETDFKTLNGPQNALNAVLKTPGKPILEMQVTTRECVRVVSFEPEAGKSYDLLVDGAPDGCEVSLADVSTAMAPPDFQEHAVKGACIPSR